MIKKHQNEDVKIIDGIETVTIDGETFYTASSVREMERTGNYPKDIKKPNNRNA